MTAAAPGWAPQAERTIPTRAAIANVRRVPLFLLVTMCLQFVTLLPGTIVREARPESAIARLPLLTGAAAYSLLAADLDRVGHRALHDRADELVDPREQGGVMQRLAAHLRRRRERHQEGANRRLEHGAGIEAFEAQLRRVGQFRWGEAHVAALCGDVGEPDVASGAVHAGRGEQPVDRVGFCA